MAKPEWGTKRSCPGCGARFYDLGRDPAVCPRCGAAADRRALYRAQRSRAAAAPPEADPDTAARDDGGPDD